MTPPDLYEKYVLPFYKKHGEQCKKNGKLYVVHIDGRTQGIKNQIAKSPFNVVESFSFAEMAEDVPVEEALKIWPDKVLCPHFPASLSEENEKNILEYLQKRKQEFNNRPFMIQISSLKKSSSGDLGVRWLFRPDSLFFSNNTFP